MRRYLILLLLALGAAAIPFDAAAAVPEERAPEGEEAACGAETAPCGESPDALWDRANTAYINNDFRTAIELYRRIGAQGLHSGKLYYNLGNAWFKEGAVGRAVLNYRRALALNPGDEDARYNLRVAERMTKDRIEAVPEFFLTGWLRECRTLLSGTVWAICSLVALGGLLAAVLLFLLSRRLVWRKTGFYASCALSLLLVATLCFAAVDRNRQLRNATAVVLAESVAVKSSPDRSATDLFILHEGTAVAVSDELGEWCEVTIADGKRGWMERAKLERVGGGNRRPSADAGR